MTANEPPEPDSTNSPSEAKRSRTVYVLWAVGLALLLALGAFCWMVLGPALEARGAIRQLVAASGEEAAAQEAALVQRMDGQDEACRKLLLYLKVPNRSAHERAAAAALLGHCGDGALAPLLGLLADPDWTCKACAATSLGKLGRTARTSASDFA